jgi:hypothetical protein
MTEQAEQAAFVKWFRRAYKSEARALRVSMAGISFPGGKWGAIMWNKMKSQGLVKGEPDIAILIPAGKYHGLIIEHKGEGMARKLTDDQAAHLDYHRQHGYMATETRGLEELKSVVEEYLALRNTAQ